MEHVIHCNVYIDWLGHKGVSYFIEKHSNSHFSKE